MSGLRRLYRDSLSLLTDLYQLTMAYAYWRSGLDQREAVFHLFFRKAPFGGRFAVACGLHSVIEYVREFRFQEDDLDYLRTLTGSDGKPLFQPEFFDYLKSLRFTVDIDAVPEGTPVFPHEPLLRVRGPILQCQLLETPLLTQVNFATLVATKAARVCWAAEGDPVIEFGLRRAQGVDGGVTAARASFVGGCTGTSNVLAGKLFGIPTLGTHAHSWVMCFDREVDAFDTWAHALPNNCVFLVDTYETLDGVRHAITVCRRLREEGREAIGIRLDSGDLGALSVGARKLLDEAGFPNVKIVASGDLDEYRIHQLKEQKAPIDLWGVGTRLTTAFDEPALGGIYKLSAVRDPGQPWKHRIKLSDDPVKTTNPGIQQVRRLLRPDGIYEADIICDDDHPPDANAPLTVVELGPEAEHREFPPSTPFRELLVPVFRAGELVYQPPTLTEIRQYSLNEQQCLPDEVRRIEEPAHYPVGLESGLFQLKEQLAEEIRRSLHHRD